MFPPIEPYKTHRLEVSELHELYIEESGNPEGLPVVFLHGGPGGGTDPSYRRFFNPARYRIVLFDQRGCGQSTPFAELRENTTWDLVADIEAIRQFLHIPAWVVFGGSWGSTLALTYAINYPDRVRALILRGIFMLRHKELQWFYQEGASNIFPDVWEGFLAPIPEDERHDLGAAYYKRLTSEDPDVRREAAQAWSLWEGRTSKLQADPRVEQRYGNDQFAAAFARIECHYFINKGFFDNENYILDNVDKIRKIPGVIVQGRYDVVCPAVTAWELHKAWPEASFHMIPDAGHSVSESGIREKLLEATERFAQLGKM